MKKLIIIFSLVIAITGSYFIYAVHLRAQLCAKESGQRALFRETEALLDDHYKFHKEYPKSLSALSFTYPDGSTPALLKDFEYQPSSKGYLLKTIGYFSGKIIKANDKAEPDTSTNVPETP